MPIPRPRPAPTLKQILRGCGIDDKTYRRAFDDLRGFLRVTKAMMAGAKIAMMTSALLKRGITYLDTLSTEMPIRMGEHQYDSIRQMQGSMSRSAVPQPGAFERANYMKVLSSYAMR